MAERVAEKPEFTPQVRELLEGFMSEAISSGLNERYRVGLTEDPDISQEERQRILAESPASVRKVWEEEMQAKLAATDLSYPFAVKKEPMPMLLDGDGYKWQDFLQLYKVDPLTGEALRYSLKGVFTENDTFPNGMHLFGDFTEQDADLVTRIYEAQESLGWRL